MRNLIGGSDELSVSVQSKILQSAQDLASNRQPMALPKAIRNTINGCCCKLRREPKGKAARTGPVFEVGTGRVTGMDAATGIIRWWFAENGNLSFLL